MLSDVKKSYVLRDQVAPGKCLLVFADCLFQYLRTEPSHFWIVHCDYVGMPGVWNVQINEVSSCNQIDIVIWRDKIVDGSEQLYGQRKLLSPGRQVFGKRQPLQSEVSDEGGPAPQGGNHKGPAG